jgi:hypothetical protein
MSHTVLLVMLACIAAAGGATAAHAAAPLVFKDAQLGISVGAWRSLAPPEGAGPGAQPACSDDARVVGLAHNPLAHLAQQDGLEACAYVDVLGDWVLPCSVLLDRRHRATGLTYLFDRGQLREIRFNASVDAFNDVMAILRSRYGPPTATVRDTVLMWGSRIARVTETWRTAAGEVRLTDPALEPTQLSVALVSPGFEARPRSEISAIAPTGGHQLTKTHIGNPPT